MATIKQIQALKRLVSRSRDGTDLGKKLLLHLINHAGRLDAPIVTTLYVGGNGFTADDVKECGDTFHDMSSSGGQTNVDSIFQATGSELIPQCASGTFNDPDIPRNHQGAMTFWLAQIHPGGRQVERIQVDKDELEAVRLDT